MKWIWSYCMLKPPYVCYINYNIKTLLHYKLSTTVLWNSNVRTIFFFTLVSKPVSFIILVNNISHINDQHLAEDESKIQPPQAHHIDQGISGSTVYKCFFRPTAGHYMKS